MSTNNTQQLTEEEIILELEKDRNNRPPNRRLRTKAEHNKIMRERIANGLDPESSDSDSDYL